jgi:hypothetical protein
MELSPDELRQLADISTGIGHVSLGSIVVPFFLDDADPAVAVLGFVLACAAWVGSVYLVRRANILDYDLDW